MWWDAHETFKKRIFDQKNVFLWMVTSKNTVQSVLFLWSFKNSILFWKSFFPEVYIFQQKKDSMWV